MPSGALETALADFAAKFNSGFNAVKASAENFHLLRDSAAQAIVVRDTARQAILKQLDDLDAAINELRTKLAQETAEPAGPAAPPAAPAGPAGTGA